MKKADWKGRQIVYRLYEGDRLLYVGRTVDLVRRLTEHKSQAWWFQYVTRARLQVFRTPEEADVAERAAILDEAPAFNQMYTGRDWRSQHNWLPHDHDRFAGHMTRLWGELGKTWHPELAA